MSDTRELLTTNHRASHFRSLEIQGSAILDACVVNASFGHLLLLKADGEICGANLTNGQVTNLCSVDLPSLPIDDGPNHFGPATYRLHASESGKFCAIVVDKGQKGIVVNTSSGAITMTLDGGDYYENTVPFSACFLQTYGKEVLVHRSEWNRLEASDPSTGKLLTDRYLAPYEAEGERPAHYLDYFHGRLWPSPEGSRLLDDGWIWHPVSVPRIWSATEWFRSNPWESEDGKSIVELAMRDDWNTPACWIDEHHVAIWGVVDGDEQEPGELGTRPGVQISNATSSERSLDKKWVMDLDVVPCNLFSDGERLFIADEKNTTVWDISSQSRISTLLDFSPHLYDARRGALIAIDGNTLIELPLTCLPAAAEEHDSN